MDAEDPHSDPDHFQNLIISSLYLFRHILKISSKSIHKFLSYLVHKQIWQPGSRWSRQWSRLLPKAICLLKLHFLDPENPDSGPDHSQKGIISSFYHFFVLPFLTYPKNIIIHPKIMWQSGSRWSRQWSRLLQKSNHLFLVPFRSFAENVNP